MRNIEVKLRAGDHRELRRRALAMGASDAGVLEQVDHFYVTPAGLRLKLRIVAGAGELIAYRRGDAAAVRGSDYQIVRSEDPDTLHALLCHAPGHRLTVRKRRHLLLWRSTRIHLDDVERLGGFVELETVVTGDDAAAGAELAEVRTALGLDTAEIEPLAYADLLTGG